MASLLKKSKPINILEKMLQKASKNKRALGKFYDHLISSDVYVIPLNRPAIRAGFAAEGEKLQFLGYKQGGIFYIAFFTSEERVFEANMQGYGSLRLAARDFFTMTKGSFLVLNPSSAVGKEFLPIEIAEIMANAPDSLA